ncbi:hypothetical protein M569_14655, partial [Genlisea aurea]
MEAPLVERWSSGDLIGDDGDYRPVTKLKEWWTVFTVESAKMWRIGGPIAFQIICMFGTGSVSTMFVGHLGDVELSGYSIAVSVVGTFGFGFMLGMGSALETLCGQAYGAGHIHMLGVYMQRSIVILFATALLLSPFYIFATPILKLLGQELAIAETAGRYTILILPQLYAYSVAFPTQKFLQAQSKVDVLAWIAFITLVFQIFLNWLFIYVFGWGGVGAAVALDLTGWLSSLSQFGYIVGWCKDGWKGLSWSAFNEIWSFVRLSLASAVMLCLEIWYMTSIVVLTGHLDDAVTAVGSLSICMNMNGWESMIFIGINAAISVRVSNELGLGHPRAAKYSVYVTVFQSLLLGILFMVIILATRDQFGKLFTDSAEMIQAVSRLSGLLGITMVLNSVQPVISG